MPATVPGPSSAPVPRGLPTTLVAALAVVLLVLAAGAAGTALAAPAATDAEPAEPAAGTTAEPATAGSAALPSPWELVSEVRRSLTAAGPTGADFVQTFVPAGFSSGESERGTLALALPDCMRWDYSEPYPKSFLLCGDEAHYWNPEDGTGRRYDVDRDEEPGLDLLLLEAGTLESRYAARVEPGDDGALLVHLEPHEEIEALAEATLEVDPESDRLTGLSYRDREGNLTRFEISAYHPLDGSDPFHLPDDIRWESTDP